MIQSNDYPPYNYLAPWHVRGKVTGLLSLVYRSDVDRETDDPAYNPADAVMQVVSTNDQSKIKGNLFVVTSADDGLSRQDFYSSPGSRITPGGADLGNEPGVAELVLSPTSSDLIFQWED